MTAESTSQVQLGYVKRAHGLTGWVHIVSYNPESDLFVPGQKLTLWKGTVTRSDMPTGGEDVLKREGRLLTVAEVRVANGAFLVQFESIRSRTTAEALKGHGVYIERSKLPPLQEGEFYLYDVIGLQAVGPDGKQYGTVVGFSSNGPQDLVVIRRDDREYMLPVVSELVDSLDLEQGQLLIDPPEGLLDNDDLGQPARD
jgi:16S rRNA processing protein RimM